MELLRLVDFREESIKADTQISDEDKMCGCSSVSAFGVEDSEGRFASVGKSENWIHLLL